MPRPIIRPNGSRVYSVRITLRPGPDDDLIRIFEAAKKMAPTIVATMRSGLIKFETSEAAEENELDDLELGAIEL